MIRTADDRREISPADVKVDELSVIEAGQLMRQPYTPAVFYPPRGEA